MSEGEIAVMKSCSDGELLCATNGADKSISDNSHNNSEHTTKLKRTFTLPRNPFNTTRMSKRKNNKINTQNNEHSENNDNRNSNKKVFRRPSWKKFINKLAQHINYTDRKNNAYANDNRVPPVSGHQWAPDQTPGVTGLRNHGNTCFMNAVLQCLAHTDILAEYFVLDQYKIDMSRRNKLNARKFGTRGELTEQLALLLKALWACRYSPEISTAFKATVERHGAQFRGTQQQDAQEFLLWLLDKVHEDLNTASKKKYKAIKTQGRPDEVIAAETLANHMRCNSSFVQAVFQAQYRSSLACPRCLKQSNTFDLFHCISVQLPQLSMHPVYVTVLYTSQQPRQVKLGVSVSSSATVLELRDLLASDTSISRSDMLLIEIGTSGFGRTLHDAQPVACIADTDPVYCIEAPQLKDATATADDDAATVTSAYVLLCWINVVIDEDGNAERFGSPYTMQVSRETSYADLQKLILKEMAPILHDDILTSSQPAGIFNMRVWDAACDDLEPPYYLETGLEHPLFTEAIDQSLALCPDDGGSPPHVKLVLEWSPNSKEAIIADDSDPLEEHWSVGAMRAGSGATNQPRLTLADCLRHYTRAETLAGDDSWRCPHCQQYIPVVKTLGLWSLPDILVIHFKRFRQQQIKGRHSTKLTTMVDFPLYGFDMTPHLANKNAMNSANNVSGDPMILGGLGWSPWKRPRKPSHSSDNTYDLYAVCYHHGDDLETGHYTAACRNPYDNHWYGYDDTKVTDLSQKSEDISSELVNNSAYILFYQKRSGIYVGSSSNSSSAASTSSVGSSGEHWISRMPKFEYVPPKNDKKTPNSQTEKKTVTVTSTIPKSATITKMETDTDNSMNKQTEFKEILPTENSKPSSPAVSNENVAITLSSPKLKGSSTNVSRKSLENKAINTVESAISMQKKSPTESATTRKSLDSTVKVNSAQQTDIQQRRSLDTKMTYTAPIETVIQRNIEPQKPMYKTSIYINSLGNVDITTKCVNDSPIMVNGNHVPEEEVTVVVNNDTRRDSFYRGERGYATLGPSGRKSIPTDDVEAEKLYHSDDEAPLARFDWMR